MRIISTLPIRNEQRELVQSMGRDIEFVHIKDFGLDEKAEILVTFGKTVTPEVLDFYPNLRWIQVMSAGVDNFPLSVLAERGITLTNVRGAHQIQMTEHVIWSMLTLFRQAHVYIKQQVEKVWNSGVKLEEMYAKTVCIVGAGRIGEAVADKCRVFGMTVLGISRSGSNHPAYDRVGPLHELDSFLGISDVVVAILPLTPDTIGFFNAQRFAAMKQGAYFINVARGPVVDEPALLAALEEGQVGAAALDVFVQEPLPEDSGFWTMPNVILTPHVAGRSPNYTGRTFEVFTKNLRIYPSLEQMVNRIDFSKGY
ncbi:MAG: D-2-hydroxyacid dehydrogenase [Desulfitobacteriaceae bacterium]